MDAEANGCSSNVANRFAGSSPSSSLNSSCTSPVSAGGTRSSRLRNSRLICSPNAPGLDAMIWPNLTYVGPRSENVWGISLRTFSCRDPRPISLVRTRAPVRVTCQPVMPMRAASTGNGTRSSRATSRCLVEFIPAVSQKQRSGEKGVGWVTPLRSHLREKANRTAARTYGRLGVGVQRLDEQFVIDVAKVDRALEITVVEVGETGLFTVEAALDRHSGYEHRPGRAVVCPVRCVRRYAAAKLRIHHQHDVLTVFLSTHRAEE